MLTEEPGREEPKGKHPIFKKKRGSDGKKAGQEKAGGCWELKETPMRG